MREDHGIEGTELRRDKERMGNTEEQRLQIERDRERKREVTGASVRQLSDSWGKQVEGSVMTTKNNGEVI